MFQRKPWHRITAILLTLTMLFSSIPAMAFAETESHSVSEEPDAGMMEQTEEEILEKQLLLEEDVSQKTAILEESTENSTIFDLGDGKKIVIYHGQQVRFEDENGNLTDYDPALIATENSESESGSDLTGYVYENRTGDVKHYMPEQLNGDTPVLMEKDNYSLTMSPYKEKEEKEAIKTKKEPTLTPYEDVKEKKVSAIYEGETITYEYQSMNQGVKETLVLHEVPKNNSFSYLITAKGMEAELTEDGAVLFRDKNTEDVAAYIDAPFMNDATGEAYSEDIRTELEEKAEGKYILTYVLDEEYLHDKERVYPVSVDPTATWKGDSKFTDVYVISGSKYADTNFYDSGVRLMPAGKGTDGTYRTYAKLPGLKDTLDGYYVESANLTVYETGDCDKNQTIKVNRVTANWVPSSITWNNKPSHHDTAANSFTTTGTQYKAHQFSVTTMVRNFINSNNHSNYGIVLRNTTSSPGYAEFYGSRTTLTNYRPKLVVTYSDPPAKPTVSVDKEYLKNGETLTVNWSGITSAGLNHVEYRIAKYNDDGSLANESYVPWSDLKTTSSSSGSASIDVSSYANLGNYRIYIRGVDGCDNAGTGNYAAFWIDRNRPSYSTITIEPTGTTEDAPSKNLNPKITWDIAEKNVESIKLYMDEESASGLLLEPKTNNGSYIASVPSGQHRFMFLTTDKAGNYRYSEWRYYYADGDGPVIESFKVTPDSGTASMTNDATPTISWRISESKLSKVYYSLSGSAYQEAGSTTEGSYTLPTITRDSTYTIKLKAVDAAGNETVSNELTYCLDTMKPTITQFTVTPDSGTTALTNDTTPTISWSTSEVNISKVLYSVNSTTEYKEAGRASEGTFTLPAISGNGDYVIRLKIVDRAGNVSDIKSQTYCLDAKKPVFTAKTIFPQATSDAPTNNTTPTVSWNITETKLNKVYCKIDSATTPERIELSTANSGTAVIPAGKLTTTGEHTIYLQAVDKAGNWSETQALTYYLDVTKPVLGSVTTSPQTTEASPVRNLTPEISFTRGGSPLGKVYYQVNNGEWKETEATTAGTFVLPEGEITASGTHTISVKMDDKAGNISDPVSTVYHVDITPPVLKNLQMPKSSFLFPSSNRAPRITWDCEEELAYICYTVNGGPEDRREARADKTMTISTDAWGDAVKGKFVITVYGEDKAGNVSEAKTLTYYLKAADDPEDYLPKDISVNESYGKRVITWNLAAYDGTMASYELHRGTTADFVPSADTLVTENFDVTTYRYIDHEILEERVYYYKIAVKDLTGDAGAEDYVSDAVAFENTVTTDQFSNRMGFKDYLSYLEIGLPTGTMHVEESSGNLVYEQNDYSFTSPAFSMDMDRTYNSMSKATSMVGTGWSDSYHQEIYTCEDNLYFVDADGSTYFFERQEADSFTCDETKEMTLEKTNGGYTITSKDRVVSTFNESGQLISTAESNGYAIENVYDQMGRLAEVSLVHGETEIRNLEFSYEENSYLLDSVTLPDGSIVEYNYSGTKMTGVEYGGITYAYQYDDNGLLNTVYDGEGNPYTVSYTDGKVVEASYPDGEKYLLAYNVENSNQTEIKKYVAEGGLFYIEKTKVDLQTGKMLSHIDPEGEEVVCIYGDETNPYLLTESSKEVSYYTLDEETEKVYEGEAKETVLSGFVYDGSGNSISETAEDGSITTYAYDDEDRVTEEETARDGTTTLHTTYIYDTKGNVIESTDHITGQVTVYTLDDCGNVLTETVKEDGITLSTSVSTYDIYGNVLTTESTEGNITTSTAYTYDIMGKILTTASPGTETVYTYDEAGRETQSVTEEDGLEPVVTTKAYDDNGTLVCETSTTGTSCEYSYDERNRVTSQTVSGDNMQTRVTETIYGTVGAEGEKSYVETVTTSGSTSLFSANTDSQTQTRYIDGTGKVLKEVDDMVQTEYTYDKAGNVLFAETATSDQGMAILEDRAAESVNTDDTVLTLYNESGEAEVFITEPEAASDAAYQLSEDSLVSRQSFDGAGNLKTETSPKGITATYSYDTQGRLTGCDVDGDGTNDTTVSYSLTATGNTVTTITDANGNVRTETVNAAGLLLETRDVASEEGTGDLYTQYIYDTQGRKTKEAYSDGSRIEYSYTSGNSTRVFTETAFRADGTEESCITYSYDDYGRTSSITVTRGGNTVSTTSWTYDAEGKKLSETVSYGNQQGQTTQYTYDVFGRTTSVQYPDESGLGTVTYTYDTAGNISKISNGEGILREYGYVHMGQLDFIRDYRTPKTESVTPPCIDKHYSYDNNGRTIAMRTQDDDGVILETFSYEYDRNSQIIEETHVNNLPEEAERINETTSYTYDNFGRLTQSAKTDHQNSNAQSVITYDYDGVGNRISMTENGVETTYTYNSLNQLMSSAENGEDTTYSYDGRGNQISETKGDVRTQSTYSVRGEMVSLTKKNGDTVVLSQENQYNHDGIRIGKKEDGTTRRYYYDNGVIAYTKDGTTLSSANVTGPEGQVVGTFRGDDYHIYLKDIQGSTTNIVKQDGSLSAAYEYSDFGETEEITGSSFDNEICYTGAIYDDTTGLYYMNARYYDPENGRFISQDTYRGELDDPGQWHLYAYCANNPINYVDPSGHSQMGFAMAAGNYVVKGAIAKGAAVTIGVTTGTIVTVVAVIGTIYIAGYMYKKIRIAYSKGGKQKIRDTGLSGYSDAEVSSMAKDKRLSEKERKRFIKEDKARKNRNKQKRNGNAKGRKR